MGHFPFRNHCNCICQEIIFSFVTLLQFVCCKLQEGDLHDRRRFPSDQMAAELTSQEGKAKKNIISVRASFSFSPEVLGLFLRQHLESVCWPLKMVRNGGEQETQRLLSHYEAMRRFRGRNLKKGCYCCYCKKNNNYSINCNNNIIGVVIGIIIILGKVSFNKNKNVTCWLKKSCWLKN